MRRRLLELFADLLLDNRRVALAVVVVVTAAAAGWIASGHVELDSSRHALVNAEDPQQIQLMEFNQRFGTNDLIVVLEGDDLPLLHATADAVADALRAEPEVADIFYKVTTADVAEVGLWFLEVERLRGLVRLAGLSGGAEGSAGTTTVAGVTAGIERLNTQLEDFAENSGAGLTAPDLTAAEIRDLTETLVAGIDGLRDWIADPSKRSLGFGMAADAEPEREGLGLDSAGYLSVGEQQPLVVLRVMGRGDMIDPAYTRPLLVDVRAAIEPLIPDGVTLGLTGIPAVVVDEDDAIRRDMPLTSIVSTIGCVLLFLIAYRSLIGAGLVMIPLALGIGWGMATSTFLVDTLTTFTGSFLVIIIGLGIDFGVHLYTRIHQERVGGLAGPAATRSALISTGPPILVGGITSAVAFGVMMFTEFRGTRELGAIASTGLLLVLLATFVVMPLLVGGRGAKPIAGKKTSGAGLPWGLPRRLAVPALLLGALITLWLGTSIRPIEFEIDINDFLPQDVQSLQTLRKLHAAGDPGVEFAGMTATSLEQARSQARQARELPAQLVSRVESAADLVPEALELKAPLVSKLRAAEGGLKSLEFVPGPPNGARFTDALTEMIDLLENDVSFTLGQLQEKELLPHVQSIVAAARRLKETAGAQTPELLSQRIVAYDREASILLAGVRRALNAEDRPFHITDLPSSVIGPFYRATPEGELFATRVYPAGDIHDPPYVRALRDKLEAIDPGVTGYALVFSYFAVLFAKGLTMSVVWAGLAVLLLVWFDMRRLRDTLLALFPLALGGLWMVGAMEVVQVSWTFANGVSMALIIGIGVDSGVHLVHRWRENGYDVVDAVKTSGKAIMVSSFTTMIAFGSMSLARYEGLRGLGIVLLLGVGSCLINTLLVLPGLLHLVSPPRPAD